MTTRTYGYARISTVEQRPELQHDALIASGVDPDHVFTDKVSGKLTKRPQLDVMWPQLREGDTLVVWRLDRLGRSVQHLTALMHELGDRGVEFRSLTEGIDTTTAGGRLIFHVFAAVAEFERDLIVERTYAGLASARARGKVGGRPVRITPEKIAQARGLIESGHFTVAQAAEAIGATRDGLYKAIRRADARKAGA